ncbi:MAG TPA: hypothetical protein PKE64_16270 [Anaerolineae bacterium]|nr:hypothetical protein [Anaerolineae bacterium]HMR65564.1 hypothetical protein [Anaerolineae bacterium]
MDDTKKIENDVQVLERFLSSFRSSEEIRTENLRVWQFNQEVAKLNEKHLQLLHKIEKFRSMLPFKVSFQWLIVGLVIGPVAMMLYALITGDPVARYVATFFAAISLILILISVLIALSSGVLRYRQSKWRYKSLVDLREILRGQLRKIYGLEPETSSLLVCSDCRKIPLRLDRIDKKQMVYRCPECGLDIALDEQSEMLGALGITGKDT